jgi:hypothetical protein
MPTKYLTPLAKASANSYNLIEASTKVARLVHMYREIRLFGNEVSSPTEKAEVLKAIKEVEDLALDLRHNLLTR